MLSSRWVDPDIERKGKRQPGRPRSSTASTTGSTARADRYRGVIGWALDHRKTVVLAGDRRLRGGHRASSAPSSRASCPRRTGASSRWASRARPTPRSTRRKSRMDEVFDGAQGDARGRAHLRHDRRQRHHRARRRWSTSSSKERKRARRAARTRSRATCAPGSRRFPASRPLHHGGRAPRNGQKPLRSTSAATTSPCSRSTRAQLKEEIYKIPGIVDVEVTLEHDIPEYRLTVDREQAADAGLDTGDHRAHRRRAGRRAGGHPPRRTRTATRWTCGCACRRRFAGTRSRSSKLRARGAARRRARLRLVPLGEFVT